MFYKPKLISPNRTQSPVVVHKQSITQVSNPLLPQQQYQAQTYYASSKTTPIKNLEQKFEAIKQNINMTHQSQLSPERNKPAVTNDFEMQIIRNDIVFKDQKIAALQKALDLSNDDRNKLRSALEQKSNLCVNKEREIAKLLATIHQIEFKKSESQIVKDLQLQIETLKTFIQENALDKSNLKNEDANQFKAKVAQLQEQLAQQINQNQSLQQYMKELMNQNKVLSQKYTEKCIEYQKLEMQLDEIKILQNELKGKAEEIEILKGELSNDNTTIQTREQSAFDQQNEIQKFLSQIKQQYLEDNPKMDTDDQDTINVYKHLYSFQSTDDLAKGEPQKINK
ncbi:unnamed protein product (macronuclear) [Paramecium tetraurelia]|uniref:Lebercilin domain-containing protein n=1 Tax=Paramecium tetraurelia TaxID=5888 RepID=A0C4R9_PARTE|nr:uncharacterized protein GSPATT00006285001 [Paramecium tetraurelia]CAK65786.1 unnamed protein product [Paramecium tetraurelia]|eukprot:XP_001433183.1 hypothetical protein (macronuclear) [Paramecium tetraurelia strain d4-2]